MHFEPRLWTFTQGVRLRILWAVVIGLIAVGLGVARLALLGWLIGQVFAGGDLASLAVPIALIAGVMVLRGAFEHWRAVVAHETAARVQSKLRRTIYDRIAALGPGTVARKRSGALSLSLIDGVEQLETYFGQFLPQFLISLLTPVLIFAFVAFIDLPVAAVLLAFALVALFAPALWHHFDVAKSLERQEAYAKFAAEFLDSIQGLATLKAFGQSGARADALEVEARDLFRRTMWVLATNVLSRGITDSAIACGAAAALALGAWRVDAGAMELTSLLIILMLGVEIFRPMRELRTVLHQGMVGMSAAQGIYQILDERPLVADAPAAALEGTLEPTIDFDGVRFRYPGTRRDVHDGLDFHIEAGARIGLVGTSGGGKSSIVRLLLRFYDPDEGAVRIGGRDLRELSFEQIRSMISVVNQDTFLFHGTVEDNIRMGRPDAGEADVEAAARAANIHDFVMTLPQGYETVVGEKGIKLSGGQRQRVAIARALLRDTPILVLDEALSAVDAENEAVIQEALDRLMRGRTTLTLAHRLSSVIDCDRILVLDGGRVAESGRHEELIEGQGVYAGLMSEQARESSVSQRIETAPVARAAESIADVPGGAVKPVTEGIIKAEGLNWAQLVTELMKTIMPWKGKLTATFLFGVLRVLAFIGVGVLSALTVLALKNGDPYTPWLWGLAIVAPLSGILHWLESWIAHDMAFRLLAEMRIEAFRRLDALAPAYLTRRRTGDLMALATHDIELVEYFFAHTVAPAFVAILVPGRGARRTRHGEPLDRRGARAVPDRGGIEPAVDAQTGRRTGLQSARGGRRTGRLRGRLGTGPERDRRLPAGGPPRGEARRTLRAAHPVAVAVLRPVDPAAEPARDADRSRRSRRGGDRGVAGVERPGRPRHAAAAHPAGHGGIPAGLRDRPDRPPARRHAGGHAAHLRARQRTRARDRRPRRGPRTGCRVAGAGRGRLRLSRSGAARPVRRELRNPGGKDRGAGRHVRRR